MFKLQAIKNKSLTARSDKLVSVGGTQTKTRSDFRGCTKPSDIQYNDIQYIQHNEVLA